jgi:hypothetical protein
MLSFACMTGLLFCSWQPSVLTFQQEGGEVPVTIKELDVEEAIKEFQAFQKELEKHREEIAAGKTIAVEIAQILDDLRATASADNDFNEAPILEAIMGYVDSVVAKQVGLVDFLESQRYRISYYANKMAASVRPEELYQLFGTEAENLAAVEASVFAVDGAEQAIADFIDSLPEGQFDLETFRPLPSMPMEARQRVNGLLLRYQQSRSALDLGKSRLRLVNEARRRANGSDAGLPRVNPDLLLGQMFGSLDQVRLQMSMDLLYLERFLGQHARSSRTADILQAFQQLVELQGGLEGPNPGLVSVLDWLQTSTNERLALGVERLEQSNVPVPSSPELLKEAYRKARPGDNQNQPDSP